MNSAPITSRLAKRSALLVAHTEALLEAEEQGIVDESAPAQWTMILDEQEHLVDLMRTIHLQAIHDGLQSDRVAR